MYMWIKPGLAAGVLLAGLAGPAQAQDNFGIGRAATSAEVDAWNIDVRPDFKGLPVGSGTVEKGNAIWDATCASCHGSFGESNSFFAALVGGTTDADIKSGHVASLTSPTQPVRTTFMKVDTISTVWDFIHRAMPWNNPKSLKPDDVYAVLAYLLNLADIVPADFTLSDKNIAQVQAKMPNRDGMVFWKGLWEADGKPDTHNTACMKDCVAKPVVTSSLPPEARDMNGDLAAQMRIVGPVRGADTLKPAPTAAVDENAAAARRYARSTLAMSVALAAASVGKVEGKKALDAKEDADAVKLATANACMACHAVDKKILGPSFVDIAKKYKGQDDAMQKLAGKVRDGGSGVWGAVPMPPHPNISDADLKSMLRWILAGAPAGH